MRLFASLLALFFFVAGCEYSALEDLQCTRTADCPADATCRSGFCALDTPSTNNETNNPFEVARVVVSPATGTLTPGGALALTVAASNADGARLSVEGVVWATSSDAVASVDAQGVVIALGVGVSDITATLDGVTGTAVITVENPVDSIVVTPATVEIGLNTQSTLSAEAFDARGNPLTRTFTWASDDPAVVTVGDSGVVFGKAVGTTTVSASVDGVTGSSSVEVIEYPIVDLTIDPPTARIRQTATLPLRAVLTDDQGNEVLAKSVHWTYAPALLGGLASVDIDRPDTVVFTAASNQVGMVTITATYEALTAESKVEVYRPVVETVTLTPADSTVTVGSLVNFNLSVIDEDGLAVNGRAVTWSVDDSDIATVDSDGKVTTREEGTVTVSAEVDGIIGTTMLTVEGIRFQSISSGALHTCGVTFDGLGFCWGKGASGRLGTDATTDEPLPRAVRTTLIFDEIHAADEHSCGRSGTEIYCWGKRALGRLGSGNSSSSINTPELVTGGLDFMQLSTSRDHTCAINDTNDIYCWGQNDSGRLGIGNTDDMDVPTLVLPPAAEPNAKWGKVAAGRDHTCALTLGGKAYCWGNNTFGALGTGDTTASSLPVPVLTTETFAAISAGDFFSCALTAAGALYCWGDNSGGKLGVSTEDPSSNIPVLVVGLTFSSIDLGADHACGVSQLLGYCWGSGVDGRLGTGNISDQKGPFQIPNSPAFSSISAGGHSCGLAGGLAFCFGANDVGQLGDDTTTGRLVPTAVYP